MADYRYTVGGDRRVTVSGDIRITVSSTPDADPSPATATLADFGHTFSHRSAGDHTATVRQRDHTATVRESR